MAKGNALYQLKTNEIGYLLIAIGLAVGITLCDLWIDDNSTLQTLTQLEYDYT